MGVRAVTAASNTILGTGTIATTTEYQLLLITIGELPLDFAQILLFGSHCISTGVGTTAITTNIRQGNGITGTIVGQTFGAVSASAFAIGFTIGIDTPGAVAGMQYSLTVKQTGATGNGITETAQLVAFVL
jgi:hypothetical protein